MNVGMIGLGSMGAGMASHLLENGWKLRVWNRTAARARDLEPLGASIVSHPRDLATCDAVLVMLANDEATTAAVVDSGLLSQMRAPSVLVNCGTVSLDCVRDLSTQAREWGVGYVAAPVLGRPEVARAGKLNVLVSGEAGARERVAPLLQALGTKTWLFGDEPAAANVAKIATNFLIASALASMGESFAIARGNGVDPHAVYDLITSTLFAAPAYVSYGAKIVNGEFEPAGFALELGRKDVGLARAAGREAGARLRIADALDDAFGAAIAAGDAQRDWSAVAKQALPA